MTTGVKAIRYQQDLLKIPPKNFVLNSDAFSTPSAGSMRYDNSLNVPAWYNGSAERNLFSLTISELSSVKAYVDAIANVSQRWRGVVLHVKQLDSINHCINQAIAFFLASQPSVNDTFVITDGTTTETFTFKASRTLAFEVAIGANVNITMSDLVSAIGTDSTLWGAVLSTALNSLNTTDGRIIVIYRKNQVLSSYNDRIYGALTGSVGRYVDYSNQADYGYLTVLTLPSSDPASKKFGYGVPTASLMTNETHQTMDDDFTYVWNADNNTWVNTGSSAISASNPLTFTSNVVSLNYAKGLEVVSSNLEVKVNASGAITKIAGIGLNELAVNVDNSTIEINTNALRVKAGGITATEINSTALGTNLTGGSGTAIDVDITKIARRYNATIIGTGTQQIFTIIHNKNQNTPASVVVVNNTTGEHEEVMWRRTSGNTNNAIDIEFFNAPANALIYEVRLTF